MFNSLPPALNGAQLDAERTPVVDGYLRYVSTRYSTIQFPQAGQAINAPLKFFQGAESTPSDITLTNVPAQNQFAPGGTRFHAQKLFLVPLLELTNDADAAPTAANIVRDVDRILKTSRGFAQYTVQSISKTYDPIPLDAIGEMGGILPDFGGNSSPSAASHSAVNNHVRTAAIGGWPVSLVINENEGLPLNLFWGVQNAVTAAFLIRMVFLGWNYVKVG